MFRYIRVIFEINTRISLRAQFTHVYYLFEQIKLRLYIIIHSMSAFLSKLEKLSHA